MGGVYFFLASPRSWIIKWDRHAPLFVKDGRYSDSPCLTGFALPQNVRGLLNKARALCIKSRETLSRPNTSFTLSSPMPFCPERQTLAEISLLALDSSVWPALMASVHLGIQSGLELHTWHAARMDTNQHSLWDEICFFTVNVQKRCEADKSMLFQTKARRNWWRAFVGQAQIKYWPNIQIRSPFKDKKILFHDFLCEQVWP